MRYWVLLIPFTIIGCQSKSKAPSEFTLVPGLIGKWVAEEGNSKLTFLADGKARIQDQVVARGSSRKVDISGTWSASSSKVKIDHNQTEMYKYSLTGSKLTIRVGPNQKEKSYKKSQ